MAEEANQLAADSLISRKTTALYVNFPEEGPVSGAKGGAHPNLVPLTGDIDDTFLMKRQVETQPAAPPPTPPSLPPPNKPLPRPLTGEPPLHPPAPLLADVSESPSGLFGSMAVNTVLGLFGKASSSSSGDKPHTPQMPQKASSLKPAPAKVVHNVPESVTQDPLPTYIGREGEEAREREGGAQEKDREALHSGQVFFYTKNNK